MSVGFVAGIMLNFDLAGVREIFFSAGCVVRKLMHFCPPVYKIEKERTWEFGYLSFKISIT